MYKHKQNERAQPHWITRTESAARNLEDGLPGNDFLPIGM